MSRSFATFPAFLSVCSLCTTRRVHWLYTARASLHCSSDFSCISWIPIFTLISTALRLVALVQLFVVSKVFFSQSSFYQPHPPARAPARFMTKCVHLCWKLDLHSWNQKTPVFPQIEQASIIIIFHASWSAYLSFLLLQKSYYFYVTCKVQSWNWIFDFYSYRV